jgi:hypothetical protein
MDMHVMEDEGEVGRRKLWNGIDDLAGRIYYGASA